MIGHSDSSSTALGLDGNEQIARSATNVFVVHFDSHAGPDRQGPARILEQLLALLVQPNDGFPRAERARVQLEQIVHQLSILFRQPADTPHQFAPRLDAVFFSSRRIASRLIGPTSATACAARYSNSSVQRVAPSGGAEQAKAEISASTSARYWHGLPGRATSRSA